MGFKSYVLNNPDLKKDFAKAGNKGGAAGGKTLAQYGQAHWEKHGQNENRQVTPQNTKNVDNSPQYDLTQSGRVSSNDSYAATRFRKNYAGTGAIMAAQSDSLYQQGASYDWKVTGDLQNLPRRKGYFGTMKAEKRIPMMLEGQKGYARVENMNESDKSKWRFIFQPTGISGKDRFDHMEGPPDVYLGNLFKKKEVVQTNNTNKNRNNNNNNINVGNDDGGGGERISNALASLDSQYASAIADLQRAAMGIPKDAPAWVKTHADYLRWLRIRSSDSGFESTIVTSATGVANSSLATGVTTKTLMAGA